MNRLTDLTLLRNNLEKNLYAFPIFADVNERIDLLSYLGEGSNYRSILEVHQEQFMDLAKQSNSITESIKETINNLTITIDQEAKEKFSLPEYTNSFNEEHFVYSLPDSPYVKTCIKTLIGKYNDWKFPSLLMNVRDPEWVTKMVAGDPLYLTHHDINRLRELIEGFPDLYQRRLRLYETKNRDLSVLPQDQFGFVLAWDIMNYLPLDVIELYVRQVAKLLRPGGTFIFTYNNCDLETQMKLAEEKHDSYCSARWLRKLFADVGLEVTDMSDIFLNYDFQPYISWAEVKRPGELKTVKAHQAMAQILEK